MHRGTEVGITVKGSIVFALDVKLVRYVLFSVVGRRVFHLCFWHRHELGSYGCSYVITVIELETYVQHPTKVFSLTL